jgi:hypothetical protein
MDMLPQEPENYDATVLRWLGGCFVFAVVICIALAVFG